MKRLLVFPILMGILVFSGCGNAEEKIDEVKDQEKKVVDDVENVEEIKNDSIDNVEIKENNIILPENIYKNEKYGFEIDFSGNLEKLTVNEEIVKKEYSIFGSEGEITLYFNYELAEEIYSVENDPSMGAINDMDINYIRVVPKRDWKENVCKSSKINFPCRQGKKLGENEYYVFESGFSNIEGAGMLCVQYEDKQKEFCKVAQKFYEKMENDNLNFRFVK